MDDKTTTQTYSPSEQLKKDTDNTELDQILAIQERMLQADFDLYEFMDFVVHQIEKLITATGVVLELVEGECMVYRAATGTAAAYIGLMLPREGSISGLCVESKDILKSDDTEKDARVNVDACRKVSARSLVVAPLITQGQAVGVIKILSNKPSAFNEKDIKLLKMMSGFLSSALMRQIQNDASSFY